MSIETWSANGRAAKPIPALITQVAALAPTWIWLAPRPGSGLDSNGTPIAEITPAELHPLLMPANPLPPLDPRLAIDESRIFWPTASLHLLADGNTTRWSFWAVKADLPENTRQAIEALGLLNDEPADLDEDKEETVLTRRDFKRFGLPEAKAGLPASIRLKTYRSEGAVAAWTLTTTGDR